MAELRQRKRSKTKEKSKDHVDCPPTSIQSTRSSIGTICSLQNVAIVVIIVICLVYYAFKISQPPAPKHSPFVQQMDIEEMVKNRMVLPFSPALQSLYHRDIVTSSDVAQRYFDQSMVLSAAFNHDEAVRSLQFAVLHDVESLFLRNYKIFCHFVIANLARMWYGIRSNSHLIAIHSRCK